MRVVDLIPGYIKYIVEEDNYVLYQNMYPQLFEHYYKYWAKRTIHQSILKKDEIIKKRDVIISSIKKIVPILLKFDSQVKEIPITLFIGEGKSNGHAFLDNKKFVVWIPIERYSTSLEGRIFVTHEIIHALHYTKNKEFYFNSENEKNMLSRQLFTEGIATYLSRELLGISDREALWADYLKKRKLNEWIQQCETRLFDLKNYIRQNFNSSNKNIKLFESENQNDIYSNRCGYFAGLKFVEFIVQNYRLTNSDLLLLNRSDMEKFASEWFEN